MKKLTILLALIVLMALNAFGQLRITKLNVTVLDSLILTDTTTFDFKVDSASYADVAGAVGDDLTTVRLTSDTIEVARLEFKIGAGPLLSYIDTTSMFLNFDDGVNLLGVGSSFSNSLIYAYSKDGNSAGLNVAETGMSFNSSESTGESSLFVVGTGTAPAAELRTDNGLVRHDMYFDGRIASPRMEYELSTEWSKPNDMVEYFSFDTIKFELGFDQDDNTPDPQYIFKKDSFYTTEPITGAHGHEVEKANTITVATSGGDYTSIKEATESIIDSDRANRYIIDVSAGNYLEDNPIMLPRYTALKSSGGTGTSVIIPLNVGPVLCASGRSTIDGFTIIKAPNVTASNTGIIVDSAGFVRIDNMIFNSLDTCVHISNALSATFTENIFLVSDSLEIDYGVFVDDGHITVDNLRLPGRDSVSTAVYVSGENSSAIINGMISGSVNLDTAIYATDTSFIIVNTSTLSNCVNGLMSFNEADVKFNGNTHTDFSGAFTTEGNGGTLRGYANNNDNDEALIVEGQELHVGDAAQGFETCIGQGDSYSDDLLSYMYNGTTSWSLGDSLKNLDSIFVTYPNTLVNTALYIASDVGDSILHHGFKLAVTDSLTVGTGEILAEYWNGSDWTEFNCMVTDGDAPFSYRAKDYFEQTQGTHFRYDITMVNDNWIANDPVSHGSVKKWVRLRIATAITSSAEFDQIKLHPSRFEINANGFPEYFGDGRVSQLLPLNIGSGEPFEGNMQSQTIYVDENIGVGFTSNRFTATGDKLGFAVNFPDNLDTSSPVNIVFSGHYVTGGTAQWTVRYRVVSPDSALYTAEPAASGLSGTTIVNATVTADINEIFNAAIDVSLAYPTRVNNFGDQLWFSIQPTTLPGNFSITNIGAAYVAWSSGGYAAE